MPDVQGNTEGIRKSALKALENLYSFSVPADEAVDSALAGEIAALTAQLGREIAVYLNRRGQVMAVAVGDTRTVGLPDAAGRRSNQRLSGIRCIHSHPTGDSELSLLDLSSLKEMRFDLMAALGVSADGEVCQVSFAFLAGWNDNEEFALQSVGPLTLKEFCEMDLAYLLGQLDRLLESRGKTVSLEASERALLVGVEQPGAWAVADSLDELAQLAETAGAEVLARLWQKRERPDAAYFIGRGKVQKIAAARQEQAANLIIFDDELSPAQQRNLEQSLAVKVLDRTALILDIFAQRARTHEGKLQVELAQLRYNLPRLGGQGLVLSRLGGGIGTRGPGETKLEVDRRRIRARIGDIEREIDQIKRHRHLHRERRHAARIPAVALVGYTNAGKSTLLNSLTDAGVLAEDKLFATLDPTTRKVSLPGGQEILLTDTVGFIQKLPHQLVAAFRATLEEVVQADLLVHVIDASHPRHQEQSDAVFRVLDELGAASKPVITVFNKIDQVDNPHMRERLLRLADSVAISARERTGLDTLLELIKSHLRRQSVEAVLLIPYSDSGLLARLYETAAVAATEYLADGIRVRVGLPPAEVQTYQEYFAAEEEDDDDEQQ